MSCCNITYRTFVNEAVTTIPYTGAVPTVTVSYLVDGEWNISVATSIKLVGGNIVVDHGGIATGVVKVIND